MKFNSQVLLFFFLCILPRFSFAQPEDMPDYRSKADRFARMRIPEMRNDLATFLLSGISESVGKEKLKQVPVTNYGEKFVTFSNDEWEITISSGVFFKTKNKLQYFDEKYLTKINNKPYWGVYGKVPATTISSITVVHDGDTIPIPETAFLDTYDPIFCKKIDSRTANCNDAVYLSADGKRLYIYMLNSTDGRNGYEVAWIISDEKYFGRVVDFGY